MIFSEVRSVRGFKFGSQDFIGSQSYRVTKDLVLWKKNLFFFFWGSFGPPNGAQRHKTDYIKNKNKNVIDR